jgi:hypothetical protein
MSASPPWYLDPDSEDTICQRCAHACVDHVAVFQGDEATYPCDAGEHFDITPEGKLTLVDEPCPCEDYEPGG